MHVLLAAALDGLPVFPVLALVRIRDVITDTRVIVYKQAAHAQRNIVRDATDNGAPIFALITRRVSAAMTSPLAPK